MPSMGLSTQLFLNHQVQAIQFVAGVANVQVKRPASSPTTFIWKSLVCTLSQGPKTLEPVYTIRVESVKTGLKWTGRLDHDGGVVEKVPGKAAGFIKTTAPGSFNLI